MNAQTPDMACAALVKTADPARFRAAMASPAHIRPALFALYAFNVEISRSVWASREAALAEMRLQYWYDQIGALYRGDAIDRHPGLSALRSNKVAQHVAQSDLEQLIQARRWDIYTDPFADTAALKAYLDATGGNVMAMAAQLLQVPENGETLRLYGYAGGLATFLQAVPELKARGRHPLPDESNRALRDLAQAALAQLGPHRLGLYRFGLHRFGLHRLGLHRFGLYRRTPELPALLAASEARPVLQMVQQNPEYVLENRLHRPEFQRRKRALWVQMTGRW